VIGVIQGKTMRKLIVAVSLAVGLLMSQTAEGAFKVRITDLTGIGGVRLLTDQDFVPVVPDTDPDMNPIAGRLSTGSIFIGDFEVDIIGISKPHGLNSPDIAELHMHALTVTNTGAAGGTVRVEMTDTDFSLPGPGVLTLTSGIGGFANSAGQVVVAKQSVDLTNTEFGMPGTLTVTHAPPPLPKGAFSDSKSGNFFYAGGLFSITEFDEITLGPGGSVSFDQVSTVVTPAPAGVFLIGAGALTVFGFRAFRKKRPTA
jgi:hypothetical protein